MENLIAEAKRIEEDATYSCKGHFEAAGGWDRWHYWIGIPATVVATTAGLSALKHYTTISAVLAFSAAGLSAVFTFLHAKEKASTHLRAGNAYSALQKDARVFYEIECPGQGSLEKLKGLLRQLIDRRNKLNSDSPQIPRWAFVKARRGIEEGEAEYRVDSGTKHG